MIKARLTVLAAVLFACGNALAVGAVPAPWLLPLSAAAIAALYFCPLFGRVGACGEDAAPDSDGARDIDGAPESAGARATHRDAFLVYRRTAAAILACVPLLAYCYTFARIHEGDDVFLLSRYKYVCANVEIESLERKANSTELVAKLISVQRPFFASHGEQILVSLRQNRTASTELPATNAHRPARHFRTRDVKVGDIAMIRGRLRLPRAPTQPWQFDEVSYVKRRGGIARFDAHSIEGIGSSSKSKLIAETSNTLGALRKRLLAAHQGALGTESGALLTSMVIGSGAVRLPDDVTLSFQKVGLSHILAASGFNLTVVSVSVWFLIRLLTKNALIGNGVVLSAVALFVALAGASASVNRAAIMCLFMLVGRSVHRNAYLPATLSLSLISTLVFDPLALTDIGFQLSYAATIGIVCFAKLSLVYVEEAQVKCPGWVVEAVFVTAVAELSVLPVQLFHFWQIGILSLPTNVIVSPMVPVITVVGFASTALLLIGNPVLDMFALGLDKLIMYPVWALNAAVRWLAALDWAWLSTGPPSIFQIICYYSTASCVLFAAVQRRFVVLSIAAFAVAGWFLFWRAPLAQSVVITDGKGRIEISPQRNAIVNSADTQHFKRIAAYYAVAEAAIKQVR